MVFTLTTLFPLGWQHYLAGGLLLGAGVALLFWYVLRILMSLSRR